MSLTQVGSTAPTGVRSISQPWCSGPLWPARCPRLPSSTGISSLACRSADIAARVEHTGDGAHIPAKFATAFLTNGQTWVSPDWHVHPLDAVIEAVGLVKRSILLGALLRQPQEWLRSVLESQPLRCLITVAGAGLIQALPSTGWFNVAWRD